MTKYVLVHWTTTNETSILTDEFVPDKSLLNDPNREGMILFGKPGIKRPKGGWKAYLGRIKYVSEKKRAVEKKEVELLGKINYEVSTNNSRKRKTPSNSEDFSDSESDGCLYDSKKKVANAEKMAKDRAFESIIGQMNVFDSDSEADDCISNSKQATKSSEVKLQEKITHLEKELAAKDDIIKELKDVNLVLQKKLPDLGVLPDVVSTRSPLSVLNISPKTMQQGLSKKSLFPQSPQLSQRPPESPLCEKSRSCESQLDENRPDIDNGIVNQPIDSGCAHTPPLSELVDSMQLQEIFNSTSERKMTMAMMSSLFSRRTLATSSVTGKSKEGRPALKNALVQLIISEVQKRYPNATATLIKASMAQKCKDERKAMEAKRMKADSV